MIKIVKTLSFRTFKQTNAIEWTRRSLLTPNVELPLKTWMEFCTSQNNRQHTVNRQANFQKKRTRKSKTELNEQTIQIDPLNTEQAASNKISERATRKDIYNYDSLVSELEKVLQEPEKLNLKQCFYYFSKISSILQNNADYKNYKKGEHQALFTSFFEIFQKMLEEKKTTADYLHIFDFNIPKSILLGYSAFFGHCLEDVLFCAYPPVKEMIVNLPTILNYFNVIEIDEKSGKQLQHLLGLLYEHRATFNFQTKISLMNVMRVTRIYHDLWLDYLLGYVDNHFQHIGIDDMMVLFIAVVGNNKMVPYELLYRARERIKADANRIDSRTFLKIMNVYSRVRLPHKEAIHEAIITHFSKEKVMKEATLFDAVLIVYYFSRMRYKDNEFRDKYVDRVLSEFDKLDEIQLRLVILALAQLNYENKEVLKLLNEQVNVMDVLEKLKGENGANSTDSTFLKKVVEAMEQYQANAGEVDQAKFAQKMTLAELIQCVDATVLAASLDRYFCVFDFYLLIFLSSRV